MEERNDGTGEEGGESFAELLEQSMAGTKRLEPGERVRLMNRAQWVGFFACRINRFHLDTSMKKQAGPPMVLERTRLVAPSLGGLAPKPTLKQILERISFRQGWALV